MAIRILGTLALLAPLIAGAAEPYDRRHFGHGWIDADRDGFNTRHEVLAAESHVAVQVQGKRVVKGYWQGAFGGRGYTDPRELDVDHVVPLKVAWEAGAHAWPRAKRVAYANNLDNPGALMAVAKGLNRSKGARGPDEWLPPNEAFHCPYARQWRDIGLAWELDYRASIEAAIDRLLETCASAGR